VEEPNFQHLSTISSLSVRWSGVPGQIPGGQVFLEQQADVNYTAPPGGLTPLAVASLFLGPKDVGRGSPTASSKIHHGFVMVLKIGDTIPKNDHFMRFYVRDPGKMTF
jgi:hypothetical protein